MNIIKAVVAGLLGLIYVGGLVWFFVTSAATSPGSIIASTLVAVVASMVVFGFLFGFEPVRLMRAGKQRESLVFTLVASTVLLAGVFLGLYIFLSRLGAV